MPHHPTAHQRLILQRMQLGKEVVASPIPTASISFITLIAAALWAIGTSDLRAGEATDETFHVVSPSIDVRISSRAPGLESLDLDGLGLGKRGPNVLSKGGSIAAGKGQAPTEDPAIGVVKTLRVEYVTRGERKTASGKDGASLHLSAGTGKITVEKAIYGDLKDPARTRDVLAKVQCLVDAGQADFPVVRMVESLAALRSDLATTFTSTVSMIDGGRKVEYHRKNQPAGTPPPWSIEADQHGLRLVSQWSTESAPEPLKLAFNTDACRTTLLGLFTPDRDAARIALPAILHLPGRGSLRITAPTATDFALGYSARKGSAQVVFPPATQATPRIAFDLAATAIYPQLPGIENDRRFDAFRRNWLNIFQLNPSRRVLSNNIASDTCAFCYYEYADIALYTPPLAEHLTALDIVRQTLDAILAGTKAYGMPGYPGYIGYPVETSDTHPSLLIAAVDYVSGSKDVSWLRANYAGLTAWADKMLATDRDANGLIEYSSASGNSGSWNEGLPKVRPSNWWDTIGFGHEDAYANALAYRALRGMQQLAGSIENSSDAARFRAAADKLKSAYFPTFLDKDAGVLAGWKSADGLLHNYWFLFVNGIAIDYGLIPSDKAGGIADRLLNKITEVGYTRFDMGLPGNLVSVARKDYAHLEPRYGGGHREDNADGFQIYENGGATACFAYFTLAALYDLGRQADADRMLIPMLGGFDQGGFEGRGANGMSNDWRKWDGSPTGYEGFLVDNYYALLAVVARAQGGHLFGNGAAH